MAEAKRKPRKATGEGTNMITVDANRLRGALKHTFEGVTMLFDCIGLNVPVGEPVQIREEEPEAINPVEQEGTHQEQEPPGKEKELPIIEVPDESKQEGPPAEPETSTAVSTVTQDDITRIIVRKIKQDRSNNEKIGAILKTHGVSKVSDLPAAKYEAFLTDLSQI